MKKELVLLALTGALPVVSTRAQLIVTGMLDGTLPGGNPKVIELYAQEDIPDLSIYDVETPNNGAAATGHEFILSGRASKGAFLYISYDETQFTNVFGKSPNYRSASARINGDDNVILYKNGEVLDQFGTTGQDGTSTTWEYLDGWAYRLQGTGPDQEFDQDQWKYSGVGALNGLTAEQIREAIPFGSYEPKDPGQVLVEPVVLLTSNPEVAPAAEEIEQTPASIAESQKVEVGERKIEELTLNEVKALAEQGDVQSQARLAYFYETGQGGETNMTEAVKWYEKAAASGDVFSQWALALKYINGDAVTRDDEKAKILLENLSDLGYTDAQYQLGKMLIDGEYVQRDAQTGISWLRKAAEADHADSQFRLGMQILNGEFLPRDTEQGLALVQKAAENGSIEAQRELGLKYSIGDDVPKDIVEGYVWFARAAAQNDSIAIEIKNQLEKTFTPDQLAEARESLGQ